MARIPRTWNDKRKPSPERVIPSCTVARGEPVDRNPVIRSEGFWRSRVWDGVTAFVQVHPHLAVIRSMTDHAKPAGADA